jgi:NAD-dependent deacetylase
MEVASIYAFRRHPEAFYEWLRPLAQLLFEAKANPGHVALAELETEGILKAIITQNIDNLHQEAGSTEVLEVHGHVRQATCIDCYRVLPTDDLLRAFVESDVIPRCPYCGGVLKPNVVLVGEQLPIDVFNAARSHVNAADLMLIAGSSLEVFPVSQLPTRVLRHGGGLIVINLTPTPVDVVADVVIHSDVVDVLPLLAQACCR